jgi:hypothetical protein
LLIWRFLPDQQQRRTRRFVASTPVLQGLELSLFLDYPSLLEATSNSRVEAPEADFVS